MNPIYHWSPIQQLLTPMYCPFRSWVIAAAEILPIEVYGSTSRLRYLCVRCKVLTKFVNVMFPGDMDCVASISNLTSVATLDSGGSFCRWSSSEWRIRSNFCEDSYMFCCAWNDKKSMAIIANMEEISDSVCGQFVISKSRHLINF